MRFATSDDLSSYLQACTRPLFLHDQFLKTGHNQDTQNATATFIKFEGKHYLCTANHVLQQLHNQDVMGQANKPVLSLIFGKTVMHLSTDSSIWPNLYTPEVPFDNELIDVSIGLIESYWGAIESLGKKTTIDLDDWTAPPFQEKQTGVAFGYLNEHKTVRDNMVDMLGATVVAEMRSSLTSKSREFTLCSTLEIAQGYTLSGMSGGPILLQAMDGGFHPVGIVQEATPSSARHTKEKGGFTTALDILLRGIILTPERFSYWLSLTPLRGNAAS